MKKLQQLSNPNRTETDLSLVVSLGKTRETRLGGGDERSATKESARVDGKQEKKMERLPSFLLPINPRGPLGRASLVNINKRLSDNCVDESDCDTHQEPYLNQLWFLHSYSLGNLRSKSPRSVYKTAEFFCISTGGRHCSLQVS